MEAFAINGQFYQALTAIDFKTLQLVPVLAEKRAEIKRLDDYEGKQALQFTFYIRQNAKWDDGTPITASDIEFSLKVMKNPYVNDEPIRLAYSDLDRVILYNDNPKKISIISVENTIRAEATAGGFVILPKHIIDKDGLLSKISVHELNNDSLMKNYKDVGNLKKFADWFNSDKFTRDAKYLTGSGPYTLGDWSGGLKLVINKKKKWWGFDVGEINTYYEVYPDKISYKVFNEANTALAALKSNQLDVMGEITPLSYIDLQKDEAFKTKFHLYTPDELGYTCITFNLNNPKFKDVKVRKAFAHLINYEVIIKSIMQNTASETHSMEHPANKATYNKEIIPLAYSPTKAKELLKEAGWADNNKNGVLDRKSKNGTEEFEVDLLLNIGNSSREKIAKYLQEEARKIGIRVNIIPIDLSILTQRQREHNFEMAFNGWISSALPYDPKQVWHSDAINNGFNFMGYGTQITDRLIDSIRVELDEQKRINQFKRFQALVYNDMPVLYLYALKGRLAINKRFDNAYPSSLRPGYNEAGFKVIGN
jgi:peptide/nickel transport system substrate-binding protein